MLYAGANADFPGDGNAMEFSTCLVSNISQLNDRDNQSLMRINVARFWLLTTIALTIGATIWWSSEDERWEVIPGFVGKQLKAVAAAAFPGQVDGVKASGLLQERSNQPLEESPQCHNVRNVRGGDRCSFVQAHCKGEKVGFINYLSIYYCGPRLIMPVAAVAWLVMLFMIVNIGASEFLCGNLSTISNILGMSQSLAGATFLALGNGSSDIFSTFAAMKSHSGSLAVGELFGAALFITSMVVGCMAIIHPFTVEKTPFLRDLGFFIMAAFLSISSLWNGRLHIWECVAMIGFYVLYCTCVIFLYWFQTCSRRRSLKEARASGHHASPIVDVVEIEEDGVENYGSSSERTSLVSSAASSPPARSVTCILFPTLCTWRSLNPWEKFSGIISAPAVLCLTLTVPLMYEENGAVDAEYAVVTDGLAELHATIAHQSIIGILEYSTLEQTPSPIESDCYNVPHSDSSSASIVARNQPEDADFGAMTSSNLQPSRSSNPAIGAMRSWDRWLLATQCIFSPVFLTLAFVSDILLRLVQYTLIGGVILLFLLLATTSTDKRPPFWPLLCFVGFAVSVVWISVAVTEVVGVLKASGIILGINDAILGLTVLAVSNSLGDLFANVAMTRLNFPVMALSGCFGAPMVNILLGIGVSGLYMILMQPDRNGTEYDPYQIEMSTALIILWASLLATLLMLLVLVPLNGWRMDRRIGIGLVAIWTSSTVGNLIMEVLRGRAAVDSLTSAVSSFEHNR